MYKTNTVREFFFYLKKTQKISHKFVVTHYSLQSPANILN